MDLHTVRREIQYLARDRTILRLLDARLGMVNEYALWSHFESFGDVVDLGPAESARRLLDGMTHRVHAPGAPEIALYLRETVRNRTLPSRHGGLFARVQVGHGMADLVNSMIRETPR